MSSFNKKVYAVIVTYGNRFNYLKKVIESSLKEGVSKIIVVDNEAKECVILGKTKYDETKKQMNIYKEEGFPKNFGLGENNILFRKHNSEKVMKLMYDWWEELNSQTKRDQLSLAYVLWKNSEKFNYMDQSARGDKYFRIKLHSTSVRNGFVGKIFNKKNEYMANYPDKLLTKFIKKLSKYAK